MEKLSILIPTYNHHKALPEMIEVLLSHDVDILIVDDGSGSETKETLFQISSSSERIRVLTLPANQGKGAALERGFQGLQEKGYTHAFQIDADHQHSLENIEEFLLLWRQNPQALISGEPIYDESIPKIRKFSRWFCHLWVWIETLSFRITDSMCGFRIYPLEKTCEILKAHRLGARMAFETEIMVRLFWQGVPMIMHPVKVTYPKDNSSTFHMFWDNWRIAKMHTRLVCTMLCNFVSILRHRPNYDLVKNSWAALDERGGAWGISLLISLYFLFGKRVSKVIASPVLLYFYLAGREQRLASHQYLERVFTFSGRPRPSLHRESWAHFMSFLDMMLDKLAVWKGRITLGDLDKNSLQKLDDLMEEKKGGLLFVSHLGNIEVLRVLSLLKKIKTLHVLLHSKNAVKFMGAVNRLYPLSAVNIIEVTEVSVDTIIYLKERIEKGEWIAIAADRVPVSGEHRISFIPFLGQKAPFPQGPYYLASFLECPVYHVIAVKEDHKFKVFFEEIARKITVRRQFREEDVTKYMKKYVEQLEGYCIKYPLQWFNFYNYWEFKNAA